MSAITETEPGGDMVCILGFSARPRGLDDQLIPGPRRRFSVGERVRYLTFFYTPTPEDNPVGFMAVFQALDEADKNRYAATQDYFVTMDCWEGLRQHFAKNGAIETNNAGEVTKAPIITSAKTQARTTAKVSSMRRSAKNFTRDKGVGKHS
jgi:hypothetical protein